ncbi:RES family NAD+ phosphorylase [Pedobacter sp. MC2016-05]|uniref:RES family NAD+ phosphorylase n=1 Tax=Pedobacter sp. MC2016-05 TaxID=2994474 RepID=UPI0022473BD3|nr:RES family NAD+ phosphorylase [Pedobacter sp. MC2016-05]MCX2477411.1 RES family NAD+ phosphorylase [Pedobacter sp. MC2016-05]
MHVYRIVKSEKRIKDLSGMGAFRAGGRWNDKGTYVLYTSENSSLAFLENLVHFDMEEIPQDLYIIEMSVTNEDLIYLIPDSDYPKDWLNTDNLACKILGDQLFSEHKLLGIKVKSAVNRSEYNILLDPLFPGYNDLVKIIDVIKIPVDRRLI